MPNELLAGCLLKAFVAHAEPDPWEAAGWGSPSSDIEESSGDPAPSPPPATGEASWEEAWSPSGAPAVEEEEPDLWGRVFTGSLRLTASYLHFRDSSVFSQGDDALALTVARFIVESDAGPFVHLSFNAFSEFSRTPIAGGLGQAFSSAGSVESAYRTSFLGWAFWNSGAMRAQLGIDRAFARVNTGSINFDIGRFPINYAVTTIFTTNDFFAPFSATAVNRIYKPGVDAARLSIGTSATSNIDVVAALGRPDRGAPPRWSHSAVLARANLVAKGFEWAILGGKVAQRWVAGGSIQGEWGPVNLRTEFHVGVPDADGQGHDRSDRPVYGRAAAGPSVSFAWHNLSLAVEYMFASDGSSTPEGYVTRASHRYLDDMPFLGRHYAAAAVGADLIPILRMSATGFVNASDGSGLAGLSLVYSLANESDLIAGAFIPWGRSAGPSPDGILPFGIGSEFGLAPISAYLETRVFF